MAVHMDPITVGYSVVLKSQVLKEREEVIKTIIS